MGFNADELAINRSVLSFSLLQIAVVASAMQTCAAKPGFVLTLKGHSDRALHINSHGKVSAEDISLARKCSIYIKYLIY